VNPLPYGLYVLALLLAPIQGFSNSVAFFQDRMFCCRALTCVLGFGSSGPRSLASHPKYDDPSLFIASDDPENDYGRGVVEN
jgi:hypothetical protein